VSASGTAIELGVGGHVLFTDRQHGNLSSAGGEGAEGGQRARERLRELTGVRVLARGYQVHGTRVERVIRRPAPERAGAPPREADGQATALVGVGTMVLSADCLPVALASERAVAMVHAGWRGLAAGVLEQGIEAIGALDSGPASRDSSRGGQIAAVVGPGAGACCYEVGPEVHAAFAGAHAHGSRIDLRAIAHERLEAAGATVVGDVAACTICDERFFSHRREGARAGRQAGVAWLS
jgi:YfiH family protein